MAGDLIDHECRELLKKEAEVVVVRRRIPQMGQFVLDEWMVEDVQIQGDISHRLLL